MQKNRFAIWALNKNDQKIFVTLELNVDTFNVEIKTFNENVIDSNLSDKIEKEWIKGAEMDLPEPNENFLRSFTDESILPDSIKVDGKSGAIRQLQNEWSYLLLSTKLFSQFMIELEEIKRKTFESNQYKGELFEEAKQFWEKVLEYRKEREISQEKLNGIKEEINSVFEHLKILKESMWKEKDEIAEKISKQIEETVADIYQKAETPNVHFKTLLDTLRELKTKIGEQEIKFSAKQILFDKVNKALDEIKIKRDQVLSGGIENRLDGIQKMLNKLEYSLRLDQKDLDFNTKKLTQTNTKLEQQLREAKIKVLEDKVLSKTEKVKELKEKIEAIKSKMPKPNTNPSKEKLPEIKVVVKNKEEENKSATDIEQSEDHTITILE